MANQLPSTSSPVRPTLPKVGSMSTFLPLSEEASLSTRGQHLTALLQNRQEISRNRSSSSLADLRRMSFASAQRKGNMTRSVYEGTSMDDVDLELGKSQTLQGGGNGKTNGIVPQPPTDFPFLAGIGRVRSHVEDNERRPSFAPPVLLTPQMRSQRLIGNSNPRYRWEQYYKTEEELKIMRKPLRKYYERNNYLIQQYLYIDRLLDSSLPRNLIEEYNNPTINIPPTITEEPGTMLNSPHASGAGTPNVTGEDGRSSPVQNGLPHSVKVKRTPRDIYTLSNEDTPLLSHDDAQESKMSAAVPAFAPEEEAESGDRIVSIAIYLNLAANTVLLILKIIVTVLTSSISVLASLVDSALDFLSTGIVWMTTNIISRGAVDKENYPVGRRRLEPLGVLVFSVIMITSFFQVGLDAINHLSGQNHEVVRLTTPAIAIMASTVLIKAACWLWCRLIRNSSVQALAQDAITDVVFNTFSIIFPLIGFYGKVWWLDPLGGLVLSLYVIITWGMTTREHIANLTGRAASKDERNLLLYLTMRFAHTIKHIQGLQAYHAGDKLNVEVDIVLDSEMSLKDSHDLGESLQYVLESVPGVERAFVHADYNSDNLPSHMRQ